MKLRSVLLISGLWLALSGCGALSTKPNYAAVELHQLSKVVNALKEELRAYSGWDVQVTRAIRPPRQQPNASCRKPGEGENDLEIVSAKISLTAKSTSTLSGNLGLSGLEPWVISGPEGKRQVANEQKLELDVGVVNTQASRKPISEDDPEWKAHQLAAAIWKTRQEILSIDHQPPCVSFKDGDKDRLMPMTFGFTVVNSGSGGAKIAIIPAPLPVVLGGSGAYEGSSGQTITLMVRIVGPGQAIRM